MIKRGRRFPHTISYRLTDEDYFKLEQVVSKSGLTPDAWCRDAALEKLNPGNGMSKGERILFEQFVRTHYLVANGFQLLADDKLSTEEWKKRRLFVKERINEIAGRALAELSSENDSLKTPKLFELR